MEFLTRVANDVYDRYGFTGVASLLVLIFMLLVLVLVFLGIRAAINHQNANSKQQEAESAAVAFSVQSAKDSTTRLEVQREAYTALQTEHTRVNKELDHAYSLLTMSDKELAECQIERAALIAGIQEIETLVKTQREQIIALERIIHE